MRRALERGLGREGVSVRGDGKGCQFEAGHRPFFGGGAKQRETQWTNTANALRTVQRAMARTSLKGTEGCARVLASERMESTPWHHNTCIRCITRCITGVWATGQQTRNPARGSHSSEPKCNDTRSPGSAWGADKVGVEEVPFQRQAGRGSGGSTGCLPLLNTRGTPDTSEREKHAVINGHFRIGR